MKRPSQKISFDIPRSHQIRTDALCPSTPNNYIESRFPESLQELAAEIYNKTVELHRLCDKYDLQWFGEKQKVVELNREETATLLRLEKERKISKEKEKMRKKEISKLRGTDKAYYKQTGQTPAEYIAMMVAEFAKRNSEK